MFKNCMILAVLVFLLGLPQLSQAMCAYNRSDHKMIVFFDCTLNWCKFITNLRTNERKCTDGKGGKNMTYRFIEHHENENFNRCFEANVGRVDDHGWTTTKGSGGSLEMCRKDSNGKIQECSGFSEVYMNNCKHN